MKKGHVKNLYKFVVGLKRALILLCSIISLVLFVMVLGTGTIDTFVKILYTTSPLWLGYYICKGVELVLRALCH